LFAALAEGTLGDATDIEFRAVGLPQKFIHLALKGGVAHSQDAEYQMLKGKFPVSGECPFRTVF
jgi:hypothetical protein